MLVKTISDDVGILNRATAAEKWLASVKKGVKTKKQADEGARHVTYVSQDIAALQQSEKAEKKPFQLKLQEIVERYRGRLAPLVELRSILRGKLQPFQEDLEMTTDAPTARIGAVGFAVTLRSFWSAEIIDRGKALRAAANEPEITRALQTVADRWARESKGLKPLPGTRAREERKAV